ncbi:MAG: YbaN family protein [Thermoplasmata archaeon]|jgi:hypothetical protein|nr:YbaN family protein [Thermoplasmata archaeon]
MEESTDERSECQGAEARTRTGRVLWNAAGSVFLALGIIGIPIPILPTTPFLLLAAACYLRGSPRMHAWLLTNRYFGNYLNDYRLGRGMPVKVKVATLALLWTFIGASVLVAVSDTVIRIILLAVAAGVTVHILTIRTRREC